MSEDLVEIAGACTSSMETKGLKPGDPLLEQGVAEVMEAIRAEMVKVDAYDVVLRRQDLNWVNRVEFTCSFKRRVPRAEAARILGASAKQKAEAN